MDTMEQSGYPGLLRRRRAKQLLLLFGAAFLLLTFSAALYGNARQGSLEEQAKRPEWIVKEAVGESSDGAVSRLDEVPPVDTASGFDAAPDSADVLGSDDEKGEAEAVAEGETEDEAEIEAEDEDEDGYEDDYDTNDDDDDGSIHDGTDYRELFSLTSRNRKFTPIYWAGKGAYNANVIPHPTKHDIWIVVAQHEQSGQVITQSEEFVCNAFFFDDVLVCDGEPAVLPVDPSIQGQCDPDHSVFNMRGGPRDARMFYGPAAPYVMYGSQSQYACLGLWLHDARMLLEPFYLERELPKDFNSSTELQRPEPWKTFEKNFFVFWDSQGEAYVHTDLVPQRVFSKLGADGSVGEDLAPLAAGRDQRCMAQYMPEIGPELESLHQATNSLSVTLCARKDPSCVPDDTNTFIMHIFQHKTYFDYHGQYDPYVILFQRTAPFAVHAISQRPLWIYGRGPLTNETNSVIWHGRNVPKGHTEMFYVTSMSWKKHGQKYHGHIDDPLFLNFGIEDTGSGVIDVLGGDLLQDLAFC